jgi:hypothetical protein
MLRFYGSGPKSQPKNLSPTVHIEFTGEAEHQDEVVDQSVLGGKKEAMDFSVETHGMIAEWKSVASVRNGTSVQIERADWPFIC